MNSIGLRFGPYDPEEITYIKESLSRDSRNVINEFQKRLIFNLFYKYFGDVVSARAINVDDYVKLMITGKEILRSAGMIFLPYIISGRVGRLASRKSINKKEEDKLKSSQYYSMVQDKYRDEKIEKMILSDIAIILSSEFYVVDYFDDDIDGLRLDIIPEMIAEEYLMYVLMV